MASSLDVIHHHPVYAPLISPTRAKFCGAFVYQGYMILVKVRKHKAYQPKHWFPLDTVELQDLADEDGK